MFTEPNLEVDPPEYIATHIEVVVTDYEAIATKSADCYKRFGRIRIFLQPNLDVVTHPQLKVDTTEIRY